MVPPRLAMARPLLLAVCLSASWGIGGVDARHISRSTLASEVTVSVPAAEELMRLGSPAATYGGGTSRRQSSSIPPLESLQVAAALRRRQYDDGGGEEEGAPSFSCKEASFTGPRWYVYDPSYTVFNYSSGGRWGDVGFAGYHVATEVLAHCYAIGVNLAPVEGEDYWHDCREPPGTQFRFNLTAYTMEIRQNWTCDDAPGTTFSGGGIVDLPFALGCSDTILPNGGGVESTCLIGNTEIRAKLTAPIDISPYEPWPAWQPFIYPPGCTARSEYPIWEVHSLEYEQPTSTASQSGSGNQTLRLNITNVSNWGNVACTVSLNEAALRASRHAELWLPCGESTPTTRPAGAAGSTKGALWGTEVLFDRDYALLGVKQHWYCDDAGEAYDGSRQPDARAGIGYLVAMAGIQGGGSVGAGGLPVSPPVLSCTNGEIGGDGGYAGQQRVEGSGSTAPAGYTCTLPGTPVNFTGYPSDDAPPRVPRTSYVHSCTINSLEVKNVTLLSYKTGDKGSFLLRNPGPADDYRIGEIKVLDDGAWHVCGGADVTPWQLVDCEYMVGGGKVGFRLGWSCDDRDPYHAVTFNATVTGALPGPGETAVLAVSDLRWTNTGKPMDRGPPLPWI